MIVARKYVENTAPETPNKRVKRPFNKQNANLLICSCAAGIAVVSLVLSLCFGVCHLTKPNIMASNIVFYVLVCLYAIVSTLFIYYNFKLFDFNVVFGYSATSLMLAVTFISIYILNSPACTFIFGALLLYFSSLTNYCFKDASKKAHSQFTLVHLFHFYIFIVAAMITLVN